MASNSISSDSPSAASLVWDQKMTFHLLELYECQPELYNSMLPEYKDRLVKERGWKVISSALQLTVAEVRNKIRNLRTQFLAQLKLIKDSKASGKGVDDVFVSKWPYLGAMTFLEPYITPKGSIDTNKERQPGDLQSPSGPPPKKTKASHLKSLEDEVLAKAVKALEKEEDQYEVFGQFVASELKHLRSGFLRNKTKIEIQKLLISASEQDSSLVYEVIENVEL